MTAAEYALVATALIAFAIGLMLGHAAGYARAKDLERRRAIRAMTSGLKYVRTPE